METKLQKLVADYKAPTPWIYRRIGDFSMLMVPVVLTALLGTPDDVISAHAKVWIALIHSIISTGFKIWTNLQKEPHDAIQVTDPEHPIN